MALTPGSSEDVVATITVVCDDEQHRHPKPEKLVTLTFYADGEWSRNTDEHRRRRYARLTGKPKTRRRELEALTTLFGNDPVVCRLCGRPLPSDAQLGAVVDELAAIGVSGVSTLTLTQIAAIVSGRSDVSPSSRIAGRPGHGICPGVNPPQQQGG